ncbi:MAG: tetratricopeptide repeat protein [Candidatus Magasanikbacteria bacterium]|nr:tetratricopeptide repeat protein [Candidatus Magasanikbacteria bacterium]
MNSIREYFAQNSRQYRFLDSIVRVFLYLALAFIPLIVFPFTRDQLDFPKEFILVFVVCASVFFWLLRAAIIRQIEIKRTVLDFPILAFVLFGVLSVFFSVIPTVSAFGRPSVFVLHSLFFVICGFWYWLLVQYTKDFRSVRNILQVLLISGILSISLFFVREFGFLGIAPWLPANSISQLSSIFGSYVAVVGVLSLGKIIRGGGKWYSYIIPCLAAFLSFFALLRLDFTVAWVVYGIGLLLLLIVGSVLFLARRRLVLSVVLFLFLTSVIMSVTQLRSFFAGQFPVEVALGAAPSVSIGLNGLLENASTFFVGQGLGNFAYIFPRFRSAEFNTVDQIESIRFASPYSTAIALLAESGILSSFVFVFLILVFVGMFLHLWRECAKSYKIIFAESRVQEEVMEIATVGIVWFALTASFFFSFQTLVGWWLWWTFLALGVVGISSFLPQVRVQRVYDVNAAPHYTLALSFSTVVLAVGVVFGGYFYSQMYLAETIFSRAEKISDQNERQKEIRSALKERPGYAEYSLALASVYFDQAKHEAANTPPDQEKVAAYLAGAVQAAKQATVSEPKNIESWQALSIMYQNARIFTKDANDWARDATTQALALEPASASLQIQLGNVEEFAGNMDAAIEAYRRAIQLKPSGSAAYIALAHIFEEEKKVSDAIALLQPLADNVNADPNLLFQLGRLFYNRNTSDDVVRAEELWRRSIVLAPTYSDALYSLGLLYEQKGQRDQALEYYNRVQSLNPNNSEIAQKIRNLQ